MDQPTSRIRSPWRTWLNPVQENLLLGVTFWLGLALVAALLLYSGYNALVGANRQNLGYAVLGGTSGFAATALGAMMAVVLRDISSRTQDIMLGFAAGMMLAASSFSLILPGIEAAQIICGNQLLAAFVVVVGLGLGVALMIGLGMSSGVAVAYPISLGLAAGAMIFVVSHEVIPETHRNGHETPATLGLMMGFAVMMFLDTALG
jgi:ZIP family zinc transporter